VAESRGYTAGRFAIELAGVPAGYAQSVQGGEARADVVKEKPGADHVVHKHLGNIVYQDIVLQVGSNVSDAFFDWIASTLAGKHDRRDGAITFEDYAGAAKQQLSWKNGLISQITFPALDAASKDAAFLTVAIRPESTTSHKGAKAAADGKAVQAKKWLASNFRLTITDVNCSYVRSIGALNVALQIAADEIGALREPAAVASTLDIPDLTVMIAESHAADFVAWHDDFVVKGNSDKAHEKQGTLEFLGPNLKDVLFTLQLDGLGIFDLAAVRQTSGSAAVATVVAGIYCEQMSFEYPKAAAPPAPDPAAAPDLSAGLASVLQTLLDKRGGVALTPAATAARLLATTSDVLTDPGAAADAGERGRQLGADWARQRATIDELRQVASARGSDWTNLVLDGGNSLVADLQSAGAVPATHEGGVALERDPFVEGVVEGAADVVDEVRPHLSTDLEPPPDGAA